MSDPQKKSTGSVEIAVDWRKAAWRKSTTSADGGCVEIARVGDVVGVRDTKANGTGPVLEFTLREWDAFLAGVRSSEFELDVLEH